MAGRVAPLSIASLHLFDPILGASSLLRTKRRISTLSGVGAKAIRLTVADLFVMVQVGPFEVDLVPKPSWGKKVSTILGEREWRNIRKRELDRARNRCEICGHEGEQRELICHEVWEYDDTKHAQRLRGYKVVCRGCNLIYHLGYAASNELANEAIEHFSKLTGLRFQEARKLLNSKYRELVQIYKERSKHDWKIDVNLESGVR